MLISSYAFASINILSNTYQTQLSSSGGNPFISTPQFSDTYDYTSSFTHDSLTHPKTCDLNEDGIKELLLLDTASNSLNVLDGYGNVLNERTTYNFPTGVNVLDFVCVTDTLQTYNKILAVSTSSTSMKISEYELTTSTQLTEQTNYVTETIITGDDLTPTTEMDCTTYTSTGKSYYVCGFGVNDSDLTSVFVTNNPNGVGGFGSATKYLAVKIHDGTTSNREKIIPTASVKPYTSSDGVEDSDLISVKSNIYLNNLGTLFFYKQQDDNKLSTFSFSTCNVPLLTSTGYCYATRTNVQAFSSGIFRAFKFGKISFGGDTYVCDSVGHTSFPDDIYGVCYDESMTNVLSVELDVGACSSARAYYSEGFGIDVNGDFKDEACLSMYNYCYNSGTGLYASGSINRCYDLDNGDALVLNSGVTGQLRFIASGFDNNNPYFFQYNPADQKIYRTYYNNVTTETTLSVSGGYRYIIDDISDDGVGELIGVSSTGTSAGFVEGITPSTITLYSPYVHDYYDPACVDTNITFKMTDCRSTSQCTYISDYTNPLEREKICTTCAGTINETCSDWSYGTPNIVCNFNTTGVKEVEFDLYTDLNEGEVASTFAINITIASSSCDLEDDFIEAGYPSGVPTEPSVNETTGDSTTDGEIEDVDDLLNTFGFGSSLWKIIFGIAIIFGVTFYAFNETKSFGMAIIGFVGSLILTTYLGLIPIWIIILIGFLVVGILAGTKIFGSNG